MPRWNLPKRCGRTTYSFRPRAWNFSLKLTEGEIDEDIYSLTGKCPRSRPHRMPVPLQEMLNVRTTLLSSVLLYSLSLLFLILFSSPN
ncbi:hypothetical protein HU200_013955 [Digitaria exilis]|uniref:Uncharacterized protein n=1 Tax=Digitaria exilis TaxID=1010633 RepID=A0A835KKN0_9POAL|nr:hypothetical protein HU200_013955 [Digitaria exilis]